MVSLVGCKTSKTATSGKQQKLGNKKTQVIVAQIQENESKAPKTLNFKASTEVITPEKTTTFKANVRMVTDSVIWMSITAYSYEVARVLATPDSIKYVSRTDKTFYIGGYEFIEKKMGVGFTFNDLQSLILAHSFGLNDSLEIKKRTSKDSYVLSSINKRTLKKMQKGKEDYPQNTEVLYSNWVNPESFQIEKVQLMDVTTQNIASIQYSSFEKIKDLLVLSSFKMNIIAKNRIDINSDFSKISVNESLSFPFKISSKYEAIVE